MACGSAGGAAGSVEEESESGVDTHRAEAVYWTDDRKDRYEISDSTILSRFDAVAAIVPSYGIIDNEDGTWTIGTEPQNAGDIYDLCSDERYVSQPVTVGSELVNLRAGGHTCTGTLVGDDLFLTAAHCGCWGAAVFGFVMDGASSPRTIVDDDDVYEIIAEVAGGDRAANPYDDWVVCRLDRNVVGRSPAPVREAGQVSWQDQVYSIGHGVGLPAKYKNNAVSENDLGEIYFKSELDVFHGDSGSPVFSSAGVLEGVFVGVDGGASNPADFWHDGWAGCNEYYYCGFGGGTWCNIGIVVRASQFNAHVP